MFGGGGETDSYDSNNNVGNNATIDNPKYGGDVGTNGGLKVSGNTSIINGKLSDATFRRRHLQQRQRHRAGRRRARREGHGETASGREDEHPGSQSSRRRR